MRLPFSTLSHKTSFNKFFKIDAIQRIFSAHNDMKQEIITKGSLRNSKICENQMTYAKITNGSKKKEQGKSENTLK